MRENVAKTELKKALSFGIEKCFEKLEKILEENSPHYDTYILMQSQYKSAHDFHTSKSTITLTEFNLMADKVRVSLLKLINELNHEDLKNVDAVEQDVIFLDRAVRYDDASVQLEKTALIKFFHLTKREQNKKPVYKRYIDRLNKQIDIYDEYVLLRFNKFPQSVKDFECTDRTSGTIDLNILHPWQDSLKFADKGAQYVEQFLNQMLEGTSNVFVTAANYYNAFQPGNNDAGIKMEKDTQMARLIVDFSSIPNHEKFIIGMPKAIRDNGEEEAAIKVIHKPNSGVYYVSKADLKKGEVIKMMFEINWDEVQ